MRAAASTLRAELIGLGGVVERNVYLTRRYIWWDVAFMVWTIANTLTIVFIAEGFEATGGQKRRLDVALGIVGRPELLFLDEPTTGFDPQARLEFWQLIRDLAAAGTTILLTTHYLHEAEALADRVGVLDRGELLFLETVPEILERFGVETLEQAFFAATGRAFEAEADDDEDREVFA